MNPSSTENPVANTPKTPAARSPSSKKPPSGARRRTSRSAVTAAAHAPAMISNAQKMFIGTRRELAAYHDHGGGLVSTAARRVAAGLRRVDPAQNRHLSSACVCARRGVERRLPFEMAVARIEGRGHRLLIPPV